MYVEPGLYFQPVAVICDTRSNKIDRRHIFVAVSSCSSLQNTGLLIGFISAHQSIGMPAAHQAHVQHLISVKRQFGKHVDI